MVDPSLVVTQMHWWHVVKSCFLNSGSLFSDEFGDGFWPKQIPHDLHITMVPFIYDESAQIVDMFFRVKMTNFVSGSEPNRALF